jgi:hypothetical protein
MFSKDRSSVQLRRQKPLASDVSFSATLVVPQSFFVKLQQMSSAEKRFETSLKILYGTRFNNYDFLHLEKLKNSEFIATLSQPLSSAE